MKIPFQKIHGAGNDFIVVNTTKSFQTSKYLIAKICSRKKGIGADGLIVLRRTKGKEISFKYYNSDGSEADFCGNGLRCAALSSYLISGEKKIIFKTDAGICSAFVISKELVRIEVPIVSPPRKIRLEAFKNAFFCKTGVPHCVIVVKNLEDLDVFGQGRRIRNDKLFAPEGTNVNFAKILSSKEIALRTYERGVEDETEACGSGACATALSLAIFANIKLPVKIKTKSQDVLEIDIPEKTTDLSSLKKMHLTGPVEIAFTGEIEV
ncbi:MAG TPA: diaminopimelate epimerase [Victivallales bacterium]|nr:diaminopimelate epimerase [Victivallales bacterium]